MGRSFSTFNYRGVCGAESKVRLYANSRVTHDLWVSLTVVDDGNWNLVRRNYDTAWDLIPQRGGEGLYPRYCKTGFGMARLSFVMYR